MYDAFISTFTNLEEKIKSLLFVWNSPHINFILLRTPSVSKRHECVTTYTPAPPLQYLQPQRTQKCGVNFHTLNFANFSNSKQFCDFLCRGCHTHTHTHPHTHIHRNKELWRRDAPPLCIQSAPPCLTLLCFGVQLLSPHPATTRGHMAPLVNCNVTINDINSSLSSLFSYNIRRRWRWRCSYRRALLSCRRRRHSRRWQWIPYKCSEFNWTTPTATFNCLLVRSSVRRSSKTWGIFFLNYHKKFLIGVVTKTKRLLKLLHALLCNLLAAFANFLTTSWYKRQDSHARTLAYTTLRLVAHDSGLVGCRSSLSAAVLLCKKYNYL